MILRWFTYYWYEIMRKGYIIVKFYYQIRLENNLFFFFLEKKSGHREFVWFLKQFGATVP